MRQFRAGACDESLLHEAEQEYRSALKIALRDQAYDCDRWRKNPQQMLGEVVSSRLENLEDLATAALDEQRLQTTALGRIASALEVSSLTPPFRPWANVPWAVIPHVSAGSGVRPSIARSVVGTPSGPSRFREFDGSPTPHDRRGF